MPPVLSSATVQQCSSSSLRSWRGVVDAFEGRRDAPHDHVLGDVGGELAVVDRAATKACNRSSVSIQLASRSVSGTGTVDICMAVLRLC